MPNVKIVYTFQCRFTYLFACFMLSAVSCSLTQLRKIALLGVLFNVFPTTPCWLIILNHCAVYQMSSLLNTRLRMIKRIVIKEKLKKKI